MSKINLILSGSRGRIRFLKHSCEKLKKDGIDITETELVYRMIRWFYDNPSHIEELTNINRTIK